MQGQNGVLQSLGHLFRLPGESQIVLAENPAFFSKYTLSPDLIARVIHRLLPMEGPYRLAIDRTNWKIGKTDINIFMLAVIHEGVAYPLLFSRMRDRNGEQELKIIISYNRPEEGVPTYKLRWQIKTMFYDKFIIKEFMRSFS